MINHILFIQGALEFLPRKVHGTLGPHLFSVTMANALACPGLGFLYLGFCVTAVNEEGGERGCLRVRKPGNPAEGWSVQDWGPRVLRWLLLLGRAAVGCSWHRLGADTFQSRGLSEEFREGAESSINPPAEQQWGWGGAMPSLSQDSKGPLETWGTVSEALRHAASPVSCPRLAAPL